MASPWKQGWFFQLFIDMIDTYCVPAIYGLQTHLELSLGRTIFSVIPFPYSLSSHLLEEVYEVDISSSSSRWLSCTVFQYYMVSRHPRTASGSTIFCQILFPAIPGSGPRDRYFQVFIEMTDMYCVPAICVPSYPRLSGKSSGLSCSVKNKEPWLGGTIRLSPFPVDWVLLPAYTRPGGSAAPCGRRPELG